MSVVPSMQRIVSEGGLMWGLVQFGTVVKVTIPRPPGPGLPAPPGLGKVIVEFTEVEPCVKAQRSLHGRKFGGRAVVASYVTEQDYEVGML
jgi:splicing factor U2AF subunit